MKVAVLFDSIEPSDVLADRDVLQQVKVVTTSLSKLGHKWNLVSCSLDLQAMKDRINSIKPDICFNLLDTLDSKDCLAHLPIEVLDANGIKHTGPKGIDIANATNKIMCKRILQDNNIPTPHYLLPGQFINDVDNTWIVKSIDADGSNNMTDRNVIHGTPLPRAGQFAEQYIDGGEFTIPFLCGKTLPIVEIVYNNYPKGKPKILAQSAKWQPESFEYKHTGICYPPSEWPLCQYMGAITERCMDVFNLNGWGRIDFRVNKENRVYVIDINANSCLAPDAWWAESLKHAGIEFDTAIQQIMDESL